MSDIEYINLSPRMERHCWVCDELTDNNESLCCYEDEIVDPDVQPEWGGQPVCPRCADLNRDHLGRPIHEVYAI